ncbi:MAG: mechanosensitive ion channel [Bacteroidia bacterium]|nr:mechanosensitive ion channel [Bacteroidia bacterium]
MKDIGQIILTSLQKVFENFFGFIPNLIGCLLVFLIGYIIVRIISGILKKLIYRPGVVKSLDKLQDGLGLSRTQVDMSGLILKFIRYFLMLIVMLTATDVLGLDILSQLLSQLVQYVPKLLSAILMFVLGIYFSGLIRNVVSTAAKSMGIKAWQMLGNIIFYFLAIAIGVSALGQAGVDTKLITANVSIIIGGIMLGFAIAYGYSARNVLSGILTSFYTRNHFKVGQVVQIEDIKGVIVSLDNMTVTIESGEMNVVFPITKLMTEKIIIHKSA